MRFLSFIVISVLVQPTLSADDWVRGSATAIEGSGGVSIRIPSTGIAYDAFDEPRYFPGVFSSHAEPDGVVFIHTSNGTSMTFRGEGHFSIERFEDLLGGEAEAGTDKNTETRSRMILNLRRGELMLDSRPLSADSKIFVETPFGRISCVKAVLLVRIEHDYRSNIYDFTVSCAEGMIRLSDLGVNSYTIYAGQRISGAGSYVAPSIEVGNQTEQMREKFEKFFATLEATDFDQVDQAKLRAHLVEISSMRDESGATSFLSDKSSIITGEEPRVIEFAPRAEPIAPFRGEVKPPSDHQADLF